MSCPRRFVLGYTGRNPSRSAFVLKRQWISVSHRAIYLVGAITVVWNLLMPVVGFVFFVGVCLLLLRLLLFP
jgi:hypothetical protein